MNKETALIQRSMRIVTLTYPTEEYKSSCRNQINNCVLLLHKTKGSILSALMGKKPSRRTKLLGKLVSYLFLIRFINLREKITLVENNLSSFKS